MPTLVALLVCLIPTTIGALLAAIGIAGMDRPLRANLHRQERQGGRGRRRLDTLLLDKTGTITMGNRRATQFCRSPDGYSVDRTRPAGGASVGLGSRRRKARASSNCTASCRARSAARNERSNRRAAGDPEGSRFVAFAADAHERRRSAGRTLRAQGGSATRSVHDARAQRRRLLCRSGCGRSMVR